MFKQYITLSVLFVLCVLQTADAIVCYRCNSLTEPNCAADKINESMKIQKISCDDAIKPNSTEIIPTVTKCMNANAKDRAGKIVIRDCHFETAKQKPQECFLAKHLQVDNCHICKGDLCNATSAGFLSAISVITMFVLVTLNITL